MSEQPVEPTVETGAFTSQGNSASTATAGDVVENMRRLLREHKGLAKQRIVTTPRVVSRLRNAVDPVPPEAVAYYDKFMGIEIEAVESDVAVFVRSRQLMDEGYSVITVYEHAAEQEKSHERTVGAES